MASTASLEPFAHFHERLGAVTFDSYRKTPGRRVPRRDAFERQRAHLVRFYRGIEVVRSFVDDGGQIFDCIAFEQQPALRGVRGRGARLGQGRRSGSAAPPHPGALHPARRDRYGNPMFCEPELVAIRRLTLDEMIRFSSVRHHHRKFRRAAASTATPPAVVGGASAPNHQYAVTQQNTGTLGGASILNIWDPQVAATPDSMNLSQIWLSATTANGLAQTVEAGWQVYPHLYGHALPVLFTYWTADGYGSTGAYCGTDGKFVHQAGAAFTPGMALKALSAAGGDQSEIQIAWKLIDGNWWLFVNGTDESNAVGYYPGSLYQGGALSASAASAQFGGEVCGDGAYPPMGSGAMPDGGYGAAAYQRNIQLFLDGANPSDADALSPVQTMPDSYTVTIAAGGKDDWGSYFFFGGPGAGPGS